MCRGNDPITLRKINERNRQFWLEQSKLRIERISNELIFHLATIDMRQESTRGIPLNRQKSIELALEDAEMTDRTEFLYHGE